MNSAIVLFITQTFKQILNFLKTVSLKQWLIFILILLASYTVFKVYHWAYDKGAQSRQVEIDQLLPYKAKYEALLTATDTAKQQYLKEQKQLQDDLKKQLADAQSRAQRREVITREVTKYINVADDAACTIPVNAGLVFNIGAEGQDSESGSLLSKTASGVQGSPSTLKLSEYTAIAAANNSEAVRRGDIIRQWEQWYDTSKLQFDKAQQTVADAIPKLETK